MLQPFNTVLNTANVLLLRKALHCHSVGLSNQVWWKVTGGLVITILWFNWSHDSLKLPHHVFGPPTYPITKGYICNKITVKAYEWIKRERVWVTALEVTTLDNRRYIYMIYDEAISSASLSIIVIYQTRPKDNVSLITQQQCFDDWLIEWHIISTQLKRCGCDHPK